MDTPTPENHPSSLDSRRLTGGAEGLEGGRRNPARTVLIVLDSDPSQICTCVKMNQA